MVSEYEFTNANGVGESLKGIMQAGKQKFEIKQTQIFPAIEKKLRNCCESKTELLMRYAEEHCEEKQLKDVCAKAPNGYEVRFDDEGLGADKHFPKSPCVATAWSKFSVLGVADKRQFAQKQAQKLLACTDDDAGIDEASEGQKANCAAARDWCEDGKKGALTRKHCPKTCGVCTAAPVACADNDAGLDEASEGEKANCAAARDWCGDAKKGTMVKKHCPKTCGACTGVRQVNIELNDEVSGGAACADADKKDKNWCKERQSRCASSNFIKKTCPKMCGLCGESKKNKKSKKGKRGTKGKTPRGGAACADSDKKDKNWCKERQSRCASSSFIKKTCPKTCGLCGKGSSGEAGTIAPTPPTPSPTQSPMYGSDQGSCVL